MFELCAPEEKLVELSTVAKPRVTMKEKLNGGLMVVTQWTRCHGNDETARVHRLKCSGRCRVASEASLSQVVAQIVPETQVTVLNPWRGRPLVSKVCTLHSAQMFE